MEVSMKLNEKIKMLRFQNYVENKPVSVRTMAKSLGISCSLLSRIETGERKITVKVKGKLKEYFKLDESFFHEGTDEQTKSKEYSFNKEDPQNITRQEMPEWESILNYSKNPHLLSAPENSANVTGRANDLEKMLITAGVGLSYIFKYYNLPANIILSDGFMKLMSDVKNGNQNLANLYEPHLPQLNQQGNSNELLVPPLKKTDSTVEQINLTVEERYHNKLETSRCSPRTWTTSSTALKKLRIFLEERDKTYLEADAVDLDTFFQELSFKKYSKQKGIEKSYANATIRLTYKIVEIFYNNFLAPHRLINKSPFPIPFRPPRRRHEEPEYLNIEEQKQYIKAAKSYIHKNKIKGLRDYAMSLQFLTTSERLEAVRMFDIENLNFNTGLVKVEEKGSKTVENEICAGFEEALNDWLKVRPGPRKGPVYVNVEKDPVTGNYKNNGRLSRAGIQHIVEKIGKKAKIAKKVMPHMLRHSGAYTVAFLTNSLISVREFLHHADVKSSEVYIHMARRDKKKLSKAMNDVLFTNSNEE